jgi:hypothetical protein
MTVAPATKNVNAYVFRPVLDEQLRKLLLQRIDKQGMGTKNGGI